MAKKKKKNKNKQLKKENLSVKNAAKLEYDENGNLPVVKGMSSAIPADMTNVRPSLSVSTDLLSDLVNSVGDVYSAVDILVDKTPFGKMALSVYSALTNLDGEYIFKDPVTGKRILTDEIETEWKKFSNRRWGNSDAGLEGVFDALTRSLYTRGDMALEIVVDGSASDISALLVIDPSTFDEWEWLPNEYRYALYQKRNDNSKVDLYSGNFIRIPYQPNINSPIGTVPFEAAILPTINTLQHEEDTTVVLNRTGYPHLKLTIDGEALLASATAEEKSTAAKRIELFDNTFKDAEYQFNRVTRDSNIITFKHNDISTIGGNPNGSIDARAWFEVDIIELCNAYGLPKIYLNSESGGSYGFGTAELQALIMRIDNNVDCVKIFREKVSNTWCQVNGFNAICEYVPIALEWEDVVKKCDAELKKLEYQERLRETGIISQDTMANRLEGFEVAENPDNAPNLMYITNYSVTGGVVSDGTESVSTDDTGGTGTDATDTAVEPDNKGEENSE